MQGNERYNCLVRRWLKLCWLVGSGVRWQRDNLTDCVTVTARMHCRRKAPTLTDFLSTALKFEGPSEPSSGFWALSAVYSMGDAEQCTIV